ncbi:glycoside hydrolase family 16 protein [Leucosporidium creatinivorum]|uniref:Glycoside hydrolase family 16 protein n=1 Tax=Leucosporidium creatinivorum TaxID=106004 RepID=A0A1Y2ERY5_9BASI|nr:glycoside hydrolase family 16 protein [Leucosporidium creatinivorum]
MAFSDTAVDLTSPELSPGLSQDEFSGMSESHSRMSFAGVPGAPPNRALLWDKENAEADDFLHEPDPALEKMLDSQMAHWSIIGVFNTAMLCVIIIVLVGLFAGWPIYRYVILGGFPNVAVSGGWANSSGQIPSIPGYPGLIDADTPTDLYKRTGFDGETYNLVFSDEFNQDGRTFWPGDDPFWEAVDLHYWATTDLEWYDPDAITTENGSLVITLSEEPDHGLNFRSGMLQSWNKFCFQGGYIEFGLSLPGKPTAQGYWPAVWTFGNLGRAGYGGSVDGMWPYTYNTCDVGTLPNQTWPNGTSPTAAKTSGSSDYGGELSYLPGQRVSACTCPGEDHPGPNVKTGRGAPEIDILEGQIAPNGKQGSASQSIQMAPMDAGYLWLNTTPYIQTWDTSLTTQNQWKGAVTQESASLNTLTDDTSYEGAGWTSYGAEFDPGADGKSLTLTRGCRLTLLISTGRITWAINGSQTWQFNADAFGPNEEAQIGQRLIAEEPMYININLAISTKFQEPQWGKLEFPGHLRIDYVRVWQKGDAKLGCDPASHPTSDYINNHLDLYQNPNYTVFTDSPYTKPKNSLSDTC